MKLSSKEVGMIRDALVEYRRQRKRDMSNALGVDKIEREMNGLINEFRTAAHNVRAKVSHKIYFC